MRREYEQDLEKIEQLQRFYDRFHAKKDKAKQAKAKLTQIERIKAGLREPPKQKRSFKLGLPQPKPSARVVLEMKTPAVTVGSADDGHGVHVLVRDVDVVLERGEKVALLGPNGSGKTTLIETVAGLRSLPAGVAHLGHNVRLAYYSQQGRELREEDTVLESVLPLAGHDEQPRAACSAASSSAPTRSRRRSACSPAASAAACACSPCSSATPTSCCSTSPPTTSTWARSRRSPTRSRTTPAPSCSSPTTGTSSTASPPGCSRSTTAAW